MNKLVQNHMIKNLHVIARLLHLKIKKNNFSINYPNRHAKPFYLVPKNLLKQNKRPS